VEGLIVAMKVVFLLLQVMQGLFNSANVSVSN
jgi:hypothetical protein